MPILKLPQHLQGRLRLTDLPLEPTTFFCALKTICTQHPSLKPYCFTNDNELSTATLFYLNNRDIRTILRIDSDPKLNPGDIIEIEPSIVGG